MAIAKARANPFLRDLPADSGASAAAPETLGAYPQVRMRRNRSDAWTRRLVAENRLSADDFIWPLFVQEPDGLTPIEAMPGAHRHGLDRLVDAVGRARDLGVPAVALFQIGRAHV